MKASIHEAKTHLSALLQRVQRGEVIIIANRNVPVAKLVPVHDVEQQKRHAPKVGDITSESVTFDEDAFLPLGDRDLSEWGL